MRGAVHENEDEPGQAHAAGGGRPLVVLHLMKTGGFSLLYHVLNNVPRDATWGVPDDETDELSSMAEYSNVESLRMLDDPARSQLEVVVGHLPFAVVDVVGFGRATVTTVVRDPVDRVVSYLRMCQANNIEHRDLSLEEIYEDRFFGPRTIRNHQTKMLGMTVEQATTRPPPDPEDLPGLGEYLKATGYFETPEFLEDVNKARFGAELIDTPLVWNVPVDERTLDHARRNLERVDVLGIHDEFDDYLVRLGRRMHWTIDHAIRVNEGQRVEVPSSFRRRIEEGNALDLELYEHARSLVARTAPGDDRAPADEPALIDLTAVDGSPDGAARDEGRRRLLARRLSGRSTHRRSRRSGR